MFDYLDREEDWPGSGILHKIPRFAQEEDIRQLFEESGFPA
jgi:hypothetical protein